MAESDTTTLTAAGREVHGSRATRRLRRAGQVPGIVYGGGEEPQPLQVEALTLRRALAHTGAVIDLSLDGARTPVLVKELERHPVTGDAVHIDFLRVRLDKPIQAVVVLELEGIDAAPGVVEGGIVELVTRELTVEALPNEIPDQLSHDVSGMQIHDTLTLGGLRPPSGVTLVDDPETVIATLTPPRLEVEPAEDIEQETERVGEQGPGGGGQAEAESGEGAADAEAGTVPG